MYSRIHNLSYLLFKCPEKTKQITGDVPPFKFFHSIQWTLPGEAKSKAIQFCTSLFSIHRLADSRENPAWRSKKLSKKGFCFYSLFDTRALDKGIAFPSFFFASSIIYCPDPPPHTHTKQITKQKVLFKVFHSIRRTPLGRSKKKRLWIRLYVEWPPPAPPPSSKDRRLPFDTSFNVTDHAALYYMTVAMREVVAPALAQLQLQRGRFLHLLRCLPNYHAMREVVARAPWFRSKMRWVQRSF